MTLREALRRAETEMAGHDIPDAGIEAELLMMHCLGVEKAELYGGLHRPLPSAEAERFWGLVQRRLRHEPSAYILKQWQFYGVDLFVDSRVLIPRPESELLVDAALEYVSRRLGRDAPCSIVDVGTGSGAMAVALALHLPQARIFATDVSALALEVARINCDRHGVGARVCLLHGDMLQPVPGPVDVVVANLPYVTDCELTQLMPEIRDFEPLTALSGGADGLDKVRRLLPQVGGKLVSGGLALLEVGQGQGVEVAGFARGQFPDGRVDVIPDLAGIDRVVRIQV